MLPANFGDATAEMSTKNFSRFTQSPVSAICVISAFTPTITSMVSIRTRAEPFVEESTPVST